MTVGVVKNKNKDTDKEMIRTSVSNRDRDTGKGAE